MPTANSWRSMLSSLTGRKTEPVYRRYAIADSEALREGVGKLAERYASRTPRPTTIPLSREGR